MSDLTWTREESPTWDADKQRVIGSAPAGVFALDHADGSALPGDWWSARDADGRVLGYGWLDATWGGDAEVLLAVESAAQGSGVGSFVIDRLEHEAASRGLNYVYNTVRESHPQREELHDWLTVRGYRGSDSDTTLRKRVHESGEAMPDPAARRRTARPAPSTDARDEPSPSGKDRGPGHEESGGYVDVDDHRY